MKLKMKRQRQTELPRFIVGALATAGASVASGATVQIAFANNYVSSSTGLNNLVGDLTGDGTADVYGETRFRFAAVGNVIGQNYVGSAGTFSVYNFAAIGAGANLGFGNVQRSGLLNIPFSDSRINSGATSYGLLDLTVTASSQNYKVQINRLIFDDASTSAPANAHVNTTYNTYGASSGGGTSAVPEASTSLGLLALGAGGILTRRRSKRAA